MIDQIIEYIGRAISYIKNVVREIIDGILSFARYVLGWFRSLQLDPEEDVPFIARAEDFGELIKNAPVKNVGIFEGVYNESDDEITFNRYIEADDLDRKTEQVLGDESLVVLK